MSILKAILAGIVLLLVAGLAALWAAGGGLFGSHEGPGTPTQAMRPAPVVQDSEDRVARAASQIGVARPKQILFGDLHVHTTFSFDAFMLSLPVAGGEGAHPPADACDFARFCSALDFWSINDHAFSITPRHWRETVDAIRQCNAVAGDAHNPDTVAFLGWEWTQVGLTPETHYGHKNVVLAHTEDSQIPARPIAALRQLGATPPRLGRGAFALARGGRFHDMNRYFTEWEGTPDCSDGVPERELPRDCIEHADTPADLFRRLDDWGFDALVIPHGTTWGFYTPPGSTWDKQLRGDMHDPERQTLIEVYSGHGNSEVYRPWRAVDFAADGTAVCPAPRPDYLPSCWQAGEIIRKRCLAEGATAAECETRAVEARANAAAAGVAGHLTVPGAKVGDWLDAGQCRDCKQPAFNYRPGNSAQYILALGNFDDASAPPRHFRMGFIASSDNHFARPGTGYKEKHRSGMTESVGNLASQDAAVNAVLHNEPEEPVAHSRPFELNATGFNVFETERQTSFFLTGGLVAAHSTGRDREAIWQALQRKEVYGTSGQRILLWFDLLNPPGSSGATLPMGGELEMSQDPIFQARAVGSFEQKPGCPQSSEAALGGAEIERLCKGDCYNPGDVRRPITRIEVVRIRPQVKPHEDVSTLIDDPWMTFQCNGEPEGCAVTFTDPDFRAGQRDAVYYVRAFEAKKPGVNAGGLRCERDAEGKCIRVRTCPQAGGKDADCLAPFEPVAWSSPIYVDQAGSREEAGVAP